MQVLFSRRMESETSYWATQMRAALLICSLKILQGIGLSFEHARHVGAPSLQDFSVLALPDVRSGVLREYLVIVKELHLLCHGL